MITECSDFRNVRFFPGLVHQQGSTVAIRVTALRRRVVHQWLPLWKAFDTLSAQNSIATHLTHSPHFLDPCAV